VDGLVLHLVKLVAASPQQVSLFLTQPEHLAQGTEKTGSASEAKIHQAIDDQHLKECKLTDLLINAEWPSAEGENGWSYTFCSPYAFMACVCGHLYLLYLFIYLFVNIIPKSIYSSSPNGCRKRERIRISNLAPCNRQPVTKIGSLE
jgi:hypothetical protein